MSEGFAVAYFLLLVVTAGVLVYVTWKWKKDRSIFKYTLNKISEALGVAKIELRDQMIQVQQLKHILSQKPIIGHVESEPPKYEGRWQDPDHEILSSNNGWEDPDHPILR